MRLILIFALLAFYGPLAQAEESMPTHCRTGEIALLDAWMGPIDDAEQGDERYPASGKLLSLCAEGQGESTTKLAFRYGQLKRPEIEAIATPHSKFRIYSGSTTPHTGEEVVSFKRGALTYYVVVATGQGHGASLFIFKGNRKIRSMHSAFEEGVAYRQGAAAYDFFDRRNRIPVAVWAKPQHRFGWY